MRNEEGIRKGIMAIQTRRIEAFLTGVTLTRSRRPDYSVIIATRFTVTVG